VSNPAVYDQISAVYDVLQEIGIQEKDALLILNKTDSLHTGQQLEGVLKRYPNAVPISARTRHGLDRLSIAVSDALSRSFRDVEIDTGVENGRLMAYLARHGEVLSRQYSGQRVILHCRIPQKFLGRIRADEATIRCPDARPEAPAQTDADAIGDVA
jgi:GTP-binding protein HflX